MPVTTIQLEKTASSGVAQQFENTYYDFQTANTSTGMKKFFVDPISGSKSENDTNMTDSGMFPMGMNVTVLGLGLRFTNSAATSPTTPEWYHDVVNALANTYIKINVIGKQDQGSFPASEFLPAIAAAATATGAILGGTSAPITKLFKRYPIVFSEQARWEIDVYNAVAFPSDTRIGILLPSLVVRAY